MTTADPFAPFLAARGFAVLDGGLATALEAGGQSLDTPLWSARLLLDAPAAVSAVHDAYLEAGADCITTAGYQASVEGFLAAGLDADAAVEALRRSVELARRAKETFWSDPANRPGRTEPIVAASAGPYGAFLADGSEYDGRYGVDREALRRFHATRLAVLDEARADVLAFETIPSALEADVVAALLGDRAGTPAWISFSCRDGRALWDGTPIEQAVRACVGPDRLVALGVNCTAPRHVDELIDRIAALTSLPLVVYPNSGESFDAATRSWTGSPGGWIDRAQEWVRRGARIVGGCCRVGPADIRELRRRLGA